MSALQGIRVCDFTGQLAGAAATKWLAAFGAEVIRIEDPTNNGAWDLVRGTPPYVDERRGHDLGGGFNNHNTEKLGITLNLKTARGREILEQIIAKSDLVTENFAAGVLERLGFGYERLKEIRPDIIYVSNCGFGFSGPYRQFKTWGPIVQAVSGLTFMSGLPGREPAGWGFSYMDHTGGQYMAMAILMALFHRKLNLETVFSEESGVCFKPFDDTVVGEYLARVDVLDKAGAYNIAESGELLVSRVEGPLDNIIGLPCEKLSRAIRAAALLASYPA